MKRLIGALVIVFLALGAGRYAYYSLSKSTWFNLSNVEINCPDQIDPDDILKTSGLKIGESIFHQDIESAGNTLLETPGIEAVKINRKLPGSVEINMTMDRIELFARTNRLYGLTRSLKLVDITDRKLVLPVITGLTGSGRQSYNEKMKLCYAVDIYDTLRLLSKSLADRLSEIHFCKQDEAELFFNPGGVKVLINFRNYKKALYRLTVLDLKGILGNSGSFDMTAGKMVVKNGV